jgi:hypothetical protein
MHASRGAFAAVALIICKELNAPRPQPHGPRSRSRSAPRALALA